MANDVRVMWGVVNKDGSIVSGKGFRVEKADRGLYTIIFDTDYIYNSIPGVTASQIFYGSDGHGGSTTDNVVIVYIKNDRVRVKTGDGDGDAEDRDFSFIVAGI